MKTRKYNILGTRKRTILCRSNVTNYRGDVIMEPITEEIEINIDNSKELYGRTCYKKDDIVIDNNFIYMYGTIDFNNEEDINIIKRYNFIDDNGGYIPKGFNFNDGTVTVINNNKIDAITFNPVEWFKYHYCLLGKPERIIVYKLLSKVKRNAERQYN